MCRVRRRCGSARALYAAPAAAADVRLTPGEQPRVDWTQPRAANAKRTVVLRAAGRCPTRTDVAAGGAATVYSEPGYAGVHWAIDAAALAPGSYCYRLFNVSATGRPTPSAPLVYVVAAGPTAAAAVVSAAVAGSPVSFEDRSTVSGTTIANWHWDFGDPASGAANVVDTSDPAAGRAPTHTYAAPGTYTVTLTVVDALGRSATTLLTLTVAP
jgi:PKD repeat protein